MKAIYSLMALLLSASIALGQITFDIKDYPKPGAIDYYTGWSDSVEIGSPGASQLFDFSKLLPDIQDTFMIEFLDAASTPYASSHPNATVATISEVEKDSATGQTVVEIYEFIKSSAADARHDGITVNVDTGALFSGSPPTSLTTLHSDYQGTADFVGNRYTYGSSLSLDFSWSVIIGSFKHDEVTKRDVEVDAWGTFSNPWVGDHDALRFKVVSMETGIDSVDGQVTDLWVDSNYYYEYWIKGLGYYAARVYMDSSFTNIWGFEFADYRTPSGIVKSIQNTDFTLYPNPANHEVFIEINVNGPVNYELHDISGKLIEQGSLQVVASEASRIDLSRIEKGAYLLTLKSIDTKLGTRKIVVK